MTEAIRNEIINVNPCDHTKVKRNHTFSPNIINLRGNVVTVIDTRARFGLPPSDVTENSRIVIIEADKQVIGILVDSVAEVVYLKQSEIDAAPNVGTDESAKFIQGVSNRDGELLILVDLNKLLSDDEWEEIRSI